MRFTYLFVLSLIHLVPKKGTVSYKFNSEPNRARQHLGVIHYESYKSVIHIPRGIVSFCDVGFKKVEKLEISGDLGRSGDTVSRCIESIQVRRDIFKFRKELY